MHWTYDTWMLANGTGGAMVKAGGDTWFFITADYAFGHALERDTAAVVEGNGGKVLGSVTTPFPGTTTSRPSCCRRRRRRRKVIGLANAGGDTINSIKQAAEFGIAQGGAEARGASDVHQRRARARAWRPRRAWFSPRPSTGTSTTGRARSPSASRRSDGQPCRR